jgi:hypothetical protein
MKKTLKLTSFIFAFFALNSGISQTYDQRLEPYYTKDEIQTMIREDIKQYKFLVNALNKGIFIAPIPQEKADDISFDGTLDIDPEGNHTFLSLGLEITDLYQYYRIKGTDKMLVVLPKIFLEPKK